MTGPSTPGTPTPGRSTPGPPIPGGPPLAEGRWLWRRLYVFASSAAAWVLLDRLIAGATPEAAPRLAQALMGLLALVLVIYLVAPTAQQLIATLAVLRPRLGREGQP